MPYKFGDVVLVPFPFTDQTGAKKRPAVIVSSTSYAAARVDVVLMAVTSRVRTPLNFGEVLIADWQGAGLLKESVVKPVVMTVEQKLIVRGLGALTAADEQALRDALYNIIG